MPPNTKFESTDAARSVVIKQTTILQILLARHFNETVTEHERRCNVRISLQESESAEENEAYLLFSESSLKLKQMCWKATCSRVTKLFTALVECRDASIIATIFDSLSLLCKEYSLSNLQVEQDAHLWRAEIVGSDNLRLALISDDLCKSLSIKIKEKLKKLEKSITTLRIAEDLSSLSISSPFVGSKKEFKPMKCKFFQS